MIRRFVFFLLIQIALHKVQAEFRASAFDLVAINRSVANSNVQSNLQIMLENRNLVRKCLPVQFLPGLSDRLLDLCFGYLPNVEIRGLRCHASSHAAGIATYRLDFSVRRSGARVKSLTQIHCAAPIARRHPRNAPRVSACMLF